MSSGSGMSLDRRLHPDDAMAIYDELRMWVPANSAHLRLLQESTLRTYMVVVDDIYTMYGGSGTVPVVPTPYRTLGAVRTEADQVIPPSQLVKFVGGPLDGQFAQIDTGNWFRIWDLFDGDRIAGPSGYVVKDGPLTRAIHQTGPMQGTHIVALHLHSMDAKAKKRRTRHLVRWLRNSLSITNLVDKFGLEPVIDALGAMDVFREVERQVDQIGTPGRRAAWVQDAAVYFGRLRDVPGAIEQVLKEGKSNADPQDEIFDSYQADPS
jgi:hypothetical protein